MTNPTLERAARAVYAANTWDVTGVENRTPAYDDAPEIDRRHARSVARAVLMAVLPELQRVTPEEQGPVGRGWMEDVVSPDGEYVRYDDLTAILAEGE